MRSHYARRDLLICWLCNRLLRLASREYRFMIGGSIRYGLRAAAIDAESEARNALDQD